MSIFSAYYIGIILNLTCLLIIAGSASSLALRTGSINLGGEGQVYLGGFITAIILGTIPANIEVGTSAKIMFFLCAFFSSILSGMLCMSVSIFLKKRSKVDILLSTFLLSSGIIPIVNYLITNDFRDKNANFLSTVPILDCFKVKTIFGSLSLNWVLFLILGIYAFVYVFLFHSKNGKIFLLCGKEKEFALFSGFNVESYNNAGLLASGALYSLCGFFAVIGTYYSCHQGFYSLYGWNGLTVALIAYKNPWALLPAAFLLSFVNGLAEKLSLFNNFDSSIVLIAQGFLLFFVTLNSKERGAK